MIVGSGSQRGCTRYGHNLAECHTDIDRIILGMAARIDRYRNLGRVGAVNGLNIGSNILACPIILIITAGVEAKDESGELGRNNKLSISVAIAVVPELLVVKFCIDSIAPRVAHSATVVAL